jgi:hypothetical protein
VVVWRTRRGDQPLSYWALRRVPQRANGLLGANWAGMTCATWRPPGWRPESLTPRSGHPAARRIDHQPPPGGPRRGLFDKLNQHYNLPKADTRPPGYYATDIAAVLGAGGAR